MGQTTIVHTSTAVPAHAVTLDDTKRALRSAFALSPERHEALAALVEGTRIERRFTTKPGEAFAESRPLGEAMRTYQTEALALAEEVSRACLDACRLRPTDIDFVVSVSCTGFQIPSVDALLVDRLGLRRNVRRVPITELGCVGGAAALARAHDLLVGRPGARALVIAVELPSVCFQTGDLSAANLVSSALFGDGAAAALMVNDDAAEGVRVLETRSHIVPNSADALGFDLRDDGFHVVLARELPDLVAGDLPRLVDELAAEAGVPRASLASFVLHPGGRRILEAVERTLALRADDTESSWRVLREYGNQSSASVLFVLDECRRNRRPPPGTHGLVGAFGPGLSTELLLVRWS